MYSPILGVQKSGLGFFKSIILAINKKVSG